jgi:hypothetical protein
MRDQRGQVFGRVGRRLQSAQVLVPLSGAAREHLPKLRVAGSIPVAGFIESRAILQ